MSSVDNKYLAQKICICRKADQIFVDNELWKSVPDRDRRELYEDIMHQLEKREKVGVVAFTVGFHSLARKAHRKINLQCLLLVWMGTGVGVPSLGIACWMKKTIRSG